MKFVFRENEGCFVLELQAENMVEAAQLVRFGANATGEIRHFATSANDDGIFKSSIVLGKSKRSSSYVPRLHRRKS